MSGSTSAIRDPFDVSNADNYQQPGFLGVAPDVWRSLANFGGNMAANANARGPGGFLTYGQGFAGPFGAAISQSQQQGLQRGQALSDISLRHAQAANTGMDAMLKQYQIPLMQQQMQLLQQGIGSLGGQSGGLGGAPLSGAGPIAQGDTPQGGSAYSQGIAKLEGNGQNPLWPTASGGPDGNHGFTAGTWGQFAQENPQYFQGMTPQQTLDARKNPQLSATATDWYAAKNAPVLQANGIEPTQANLGIAHTLGPQGASVLKFPDQTPLSQAFSLTQPQQAAQILAQNPQYQNMTVGGLKAKYQAAFPAPGSYQVAQAGGALPGPGAGAAPGAPSNLSPQSSTADYTKDPAYQRAMGLYKMASIYGMSPLTARLSETYKSMADQQLQLAFAGPKATAQKAAETAIELQAAGPLALAKAQNSNIELKPAGMALQPLGNGQYNTLKNPQLEKVTDPATGQETYQHVSPASPLAPPGTPGESAPVLGPNGQPAVAKLAPNLQAARSKAYEDFAGKDTDAFVAANGTQQWLEQMDHAANQLNSAGGFLGTGPSAPARISFANNVNDILRTAGLPAAFDPSAVASWEEMKKATTTAGFELSSHYEGHSRQAAQTIVNATSAVPSASNSPMGFHLVSSGIKEASQMIIDLHNYKQPIYDSNGDLNKAETEFLKTNQPQMYARRAISTVTPYDVKQDSDLARFLPGTFVNYKGRVVQVPERAGAPPIPSFLQQQQQPAAAASAPPGGGNG